ncbi:co-chaperone protein p23-1 isoform X3 [Jatropha curcas]|uniref:co-chaperone protein p23-1 isoform X3 n=1 Tax=Jatropha curcas TaxID=180498 RepID=UPI0009D6DB50|nr:co-chaperone protein p23-1 isoform X3 [Jatropha curcas]
MSRHPIVKWAQRSDKVYITVELPDAKDVKLKLDPEGRFIFSATKDDVPYEVDIELFDKINVEESKYNIGVRSIAYVIKKAEKKWWNRLMKQEGKPPVFLKVDWDKWVDEDDENDGGRLDFDDMDFSKEQTPKKHQKGKKQKQKLVHRLLRRLRLDCLGKQQV